MRGNASGSNGQDEAPLTRLCEAPPPEGGDDAAWALDLLREAPAHRPRSGERQRVLLRLRRPSAPLRHIWSVRVTAAASALLAATTIAWAGRGQIPRWLAALSGPAPGRAARIEHAGSSALRHALPQTGAIVAAPETPAPEMQPRPNLSAGPPSEALKPSRRRLASLDPRAGDAELVLHALRALRRDGDPALARALSAAYLERHPNGALAEEALALNVEAAVAHRDPDASALGVRYLRRYPNGPFCGLARQASRAATSAP